MSSAPSDSRLQERYEQLNLIVARRNEFLRELFRMMRNRDNINATYPEDEGDDTRFQTFLQRFDLKEDPERGSISNLTEEDATFAPHNPTSPSPKSSPVNIPPSGETKPTASSTRTTRSRTRANDPIKSLSPPPLAITVVDNHLANKADEHPSSQSAPPNVASPTSLQRESLDVEESDEDNDELDLIGSSTFSVDGRVKSAEPITGIQKTDHVQDVSEDYEESQLPPPPLSPSVRPTSVNEEDAHESTTDKLDAEPEIVSQAAEEPLPDVDEMDAEEEGDAAAAAATVLKDEEAMDVDEDRSTEMSQDKTEPAEDAKALDKPMDIESDKKEDAPQEIELAISAPTEEVPPRPPAKYIPIHIPLPPTIHKPIVIPAPQIAPEEPPFNLDVEPEQQVVQPPSPIATYRQQFDPQYPIPPLSVLPPEFTRKAKTSRRKREKERDKEGKKDKDEVLPMGLNRWGATVMANPLWKKVAMAELRLIRTLERIESLKDEGRWGFRQPKKQRGVGGLVKTHWDYLLDEMKWMRIDFREERRWKMALAYNLSTAVLEWHFAKTPEERLRAGICVKWKPASLKDEESVPEALPNDSSQAEPYQREQSNPSLLGVDYGSDDDDDDDQDKDPQSVMDVLEPAKLIEDALETNNDIQPKSEEVEDRSALQLSYVPQAEVSDAVVDDAMKLSSDANEEGANDPENGLKSTSGNPILGGESKSSSQSTNGDVVLAKPPKSVLAPLRERLAYDDSLFVDLANLSITTSTPAGSETKLALDAMDLESLFPDLQPFGLLDTPPLVPPPTEGKKKGEKKSDRDDPNKRIEDTTYTKLYPTGRFMYSKPTLIGPLQPAKRLKDGKWQPMEQVAVPPEADPGSRVPEETTNELFDSRPTNANIALQFVSSLKDKDSRKRGVDHLWSTSDDTLLKSLVDKYSMNWALIAECYNSCRLTTPNDKRTPLDCAERWKERWGAERKVPTMTDASQTPGEDGTGASSSQIMTRGTKRLASASVSSAIMPAGTAGSEPKKRRRHYLIQDSVKKVAKKRAEVLNKAIANASRKPPAVHETHNQYNKMPKYTPAELSRMKAERDRDNQDLALARRRQEEQQRQSLLREQNQRAGGVVQQPQQQAAQPQQQVQTPTPPQPAQPAQAPQGQQPLTAQQQQQFQQLTLQQLQAAQATQNRQNASAAGLANRTVRLPPTVNGRPVGQQAQLLIQARALQTQVQLQGGAQGNLVQGLLPQNSGNANNYYNQLQANLTPEQLELLRAATLVDWLVVVKVGLGTPLGSKLSSLPPPSSPATMASNSKPNVAYDPLPLTGDDQPTTSLYNAPPSPDPRLSSFHTPQMNPTELGRFEGSYRDDPRGSYYTGDQNVPMSPVGATGGRTLEEKRTAYAPPRAKSRRKIMILAVVAALVLLLLAVVIPVYFFVVRPNNNESSNASTSSGSSASKSNHATATSSAPTPSATPVTGGHGSEITMEDGTKFTYHNPFGGYWYYDENDPFNNGARAQSWSPALNETFHYGTDKMRGVNLGGWLNTEPFISPALYEKYLNNPTPAVDEWTLSEAMRADTAGGGINQLEDHYKTFITEKDFAEIAGAGLNFIRIPIGFWIIEVRDEEPFLPKVSWTYFLKAIKWARKYGLRINLDLHALPGSQNGWNHSGRLGTTGFLNGPMGYANAQRSLDYIRILAEFISQPQYKDVVTIFGIINEPQGSVMGQDALARFYLEAYNIIRTAGGTGEGNGPYVSIHDGFLPRSDWVNTFPNADRITLDSHPYLCFNGQSSAPISTYATTPCTSWGGAVNNSMASFGLTNAGEFSNAVTDCGLFLNGVNLGTRYEGTYIGVWPRMGSCSTWTDWQNYDVATKRAIRQFALASMDALQVSLLFFNVWLGLTISAGLLLLDLEDWQLEPHWQG
ncbi:hypothetical protein NLJ89_g941 [Agrocybe chaxingu]|uniref:glucan 1,3-beta-glucosidase n=1 Tax=Agrocybe chaxingu TaxID=84603 RepID=A0A9W8N0X6_9AGAR|nr:hypothetical protein NLJ89_g941 [Agrocybe chaxingu]